MQTNPLKNGGILLMMYPQMSCICNSGAPIKIAMPTKAIKNFTTKLSIPEYQKTLLACIELEAMYTLCIIGGST
ncbi:hypothetical protein [Cardinium endosymbiont of Tipula unca]|uniref:hypothetical protein n=1 Tax=Cardinium endosymbiont of Tipula unca TaxID=3066216 RepID=UPI0030D1F0C5